MAIALKTWLDHWKSYVAWVSVALFLCIIQLSVYPSIVNSGESIEALLDAFPEAYKEIFRMEDYTSGAGYLGTELFSLAIPFIFIAVGSTWGASHSALEEERLTADLLFALPLRRFNILLQMISAEVVALAILGALVVITLAIGARIVDMEISTSGLLAATTSSALIGWLYAGFSLMIGAATGRKSATLGITTGLAVVAFIFYSLDPLVDTFAMITPVNPFEWMLSGKPISNGLQLSGGLTLFLVGAAFHVAGLWAFERRDLRA
jgi:ABC-2 type transport system permease protein